MVTFPVLVTVAAGVYAPGHLGELTRYLPFELADDVLEMSGAVQRRTRVLPSRAGVYFVLALAMFPGAGYLRVWGKLTAGLEGLGLPEPSEKALRDLRRRVGRAPVKAMFGSVAVPLAPPGTPGVFWRGLRTVAFDGLNSVKVPDSKANRSWLGKVVSKLGREAGYPALRIVALAETGTRGLLGAVIGEDGREAELTGARRLTRLLAAGMLLLGDRAYDCAGLMCEVVTTGAHFLIRGTAVRKPPVLVILPDGSYLSAVETGDRCLRVRIIEADVEVTGDGGSRAGDGYRLITSLLDWRRYPAWELARLYHERWEIEVTYLALRHTLLKGHVLRSGDRAGAEQELWALLTVYQALRMAMTDAALAAGTDPDRASFTIALETAKEQLIAAAGITGTGGPGGTGRIGTAVLAGLLPARRARYSARKVKCPTSRYAADHSRPALPENITHAGITIRTPAPDRPAARPRWKPDPTGQPRPLTPRQKITAHLASSPGHDHAIRDLAQLAGWTTRQARTELAHWASKGFITRTSPGRYTLPAPARLTTDAGP